MGAAEVIAFAEVRARKQWDALRHQLHDRFDQWLAGFEEQLHEPAPPFAQVTETVWNLRHALTGGLTATIGAHAHQGAYPRKQIHCPPCDRLLTARAPVLRPVETMGGPVQLERPDCSCRPCHCGQYPLDEVVGLTAGRTQRDGHKAATKLVTDGPYDEASTLLRDLIGLARGRARLHTLPHRVAPGLTVRDGARWRDEIQRRMASVAAGRLRRPVLVLGIDGAEVPPRPESARGHRPGPGRQRARRARWQGQWRDAKGWRGSRLDGARMVPVRSGPQGQKEDQRGEALQQVQEAGVIPIDQGRLCVVADGASWRGTHVKAWFPGARQVLDYSQGAAYLHGVANAQ